MNDKAFRIPIQRLLSVSLACTLAVLASSICPAQDHRNGMVPTSKVEETAKPYAPEFFGKLEKRVRFGMAISHDGNQCYFAVALQDQGRFREEIRFTQRGADGNWAQPQPLLPSEKTYKYVDPHFSPDGKRLFFIYTKPAEKATKRRRPMFDIWYVQRKENGWSEPIQLAAPISTEDAEEYYVSLTSSEKIYFGSNRADRNNFDLYCSQRDDKGRYAKPQRLKGSVNSEKYEADVFVDPDETYIIFSSSGRKDGLGQGDLYVSFKDSAGNWSAGKNLGPCVNSDQQEFAPSLSRDQKALFFSRGGVIHWVSTSVIDDLKP